MQQLQSMRVFVEVVAQSSFTRAAHALHLGVASVSEHVARLETHTGARLLNRTTRALAPTEAGQAYYDMCQRVLAEIDATEAALGGTGSPRGRVRVQLPDGILRNQVIPALSRFRTRYPLIALELLHSDNMFSASRGLADITIRAALPFAQDLPRGGRALGTSRSVFVASPAYLSRKGMPASPEDLRQHDCLGFVDPLSGRHWEWHFERDGIRSALLPDFRFTTTRGEFLADMALAELGITADLECNIRRHLTSGALVPVLPEYGFAQPVGTLLQERGSPDAGRISAVASFLLAACQ